MQMTTDDLGHPAARRDYPAAETQRAQRPYRMQSGYSPSHQVRQAPRGWSGPREADHRQGRPPAPLAQPRPPKPWPSQPRPSQPVLAPQSPAQQAAVQSASVRPVLARDAGPVPLPRQEPRRGRRRTWPQLVGGALISGVCVAAAVWYVPRVIADDRLVMTGTVSSSGVVALNFAGPGQIGKVNVRLNQVVHKGEVLAMEYAPDAQSVVTADKAAVFAVQAKIAQLRAAAATDPSHAAAGADAAGKAEMSAAQAQLAAAQSQLATDRLKVIATEIVAPAAGTVVAVNGQPGVAVTAAGIRSYATDTRQASTTQGPQFSLVPEGPQAVRRNGTSNTSLPVVALRVSADWQVVALIPEGSVSSCQAGRQVTISVPTARITSVAGQVQQVIPTPVSTAQGPYYQVVISITGHTVTAPINGMAADIELR